MAHLTNSTAWGLDTGADRGWVTRARCRRRDDLDEMFVPGADQNVTKRLCVPCPVNLDCLAEALDARVPWGVWGGVTERDRRRMLAANPDVTSWRPLLVAYAAGAARKAPARRPVEAKVRRPPSLDGKHGDERAYARHYRVGEEPCWPCKLAHRKTMQDYYLDRKAER